MYPYTPLIGSQIRILNILPAVDAEAEIRCELHHREFEQGTYNALSYVWGNPNPRQSIYIADTLVEVTPNLFAALRNLRHTSDKLCLWVDYLCINQNDVQEKTSQVKRMTEIYANAMSVFMWVGEEENDSDLAMDLIQRLGTQLTGNFTLNNDNFQELRAHLAEQLAEGAENEAGTDVTPVIFEPFTTTPIQFGLANNAPEDPQYTVNTLLEVFRSERFGPHWNALSRLFRRPYWYRVWIIQEIVTTFQPVLCCGSMRASWSAFMVIALHFNVFQNANPSTEALGTMASAELVVKQYAQLHFNVFFDKKPSLLEGLAQFRRYRATDPRDHVYAILNLVNQKGFEPDYGKSTSETYMDVVKFIIEQDQTLDVLSACKPSRHLGSLLRLQSKMDFKESLDKVALITNLPSSSEDHPYYQSANPWSFQSIVTNWQEALQQATESVRYLDALCLEAATPGKDDLDSTEDTEVLLRVAPNIRSGRPKVQNILTYCTQSIMRLVNAVEEVGILHDTLFTGESLDPKDESQMKKKAELFCKSLADISLDREEFLKLFPTTISKLKEFMDLFSRLESLRPDLMYQPMFDPHRAEVLGVFTDCRDSFHQFSRSIFHEPEEASFGSTSEKIEVSNVLDESDPAAEAAPVPILSGMPSQSSDDKERALAGLDSTIEPSDTSPKPIDYERLANNTYALSKKFMDATSDLILPSWVPDWRTGILEYENLVLRNPGNCHYKTGGTKPSFHFPNDENMMIVDGLGLGSVRAMALEDYEDHELRIKDEWNIWLTASHPRHVYGSQKYQQEAFIRTLSAGRNEDGSKGNGGLTAHLLDETFHMGFVEVDEAECNTNWTPKIYLELELSGRGFKFGITDQGFMARVPKITEKGDIIAILLGARAPFVLRRNEKLNVYLVVGECYVDGVMEGEVVEELANKVRPLEDLQEFRLV